ncbi:MAG: MATE family efflux transporter, partial [Oscillospiraceae bacterium]|nr:MATE family efflux transporter [Oscillospiraceae bacterium]
MVLALGCCGCVVLLCIRGPILSLYAISDEARAAAYGVITVLACVQPSFAIDATSIVGILRGGGDTRTAFAIDCGGLWLISIPLGLLAGFVLKLPLPFVYLCMKMDSPVKATLSFIRIQSGNWIRNVTR